MVIVGGSEGDMMAGSSRFSHASFVYPCPYIDPIGFVDAFASSTQFAINHRGWQAELLAGTGVGLVLPPQDAEKAALGLNESGRLLGPQGSKQGGPKVR